MSEPSTKWFKLWISSLTDPDTSNLSNERFAQWVKLGTYIKAHGDRGNIIIKPPGTVICSILQIPDFNSLFLCISLFPNVELRRLENDNADISVTYLNWSQYQVDSTSYDRVKKYRKSKNDNALRGEKEERKNITPISPKTGESKFDLFWNTYPKHLGKQKAKTSWDRLKPNQTLLETIFKSLELQKQTDEWTKDKGKFVPHPATWLNGRRWEDELEILNEAPQFLEGVK